VKYKILGKTDTEVPAIGQGSSGIGGYFSPDSTYNDKQIAALRIGIKHGMTFLDTAEGYGGGYTEELIGRAIHDIREKVFIATKFSPEHTAYNDVITSAEGSLHRLGVDHIDLYQVHWPNPEVQIGETMRALEHLVNQGKVRHIGVSNFSLSQLKEARGALEKYDIVSNQVEYSLFDRSIERDILPYCENEGISIIAYSPLDQGKAVSGETGNLLGKLAQKYGVTPSQIALNWLGAHLSVISIPKAVTKIHIVENASALDFDIAKGDLDAIEKASSKECLLVPTQNIQVSVHGERAREVYQTVEEAVANRLEFCPSPMVLAKYIRAHPNENIKPVRLLRSVDEEGKGDYYDLVEGRVRYWAWVLAFDGRRPIPAYVRE